MKTIGMSAIAAGLFALASAATGSERKAVTIHIDASGVNFADQAGCRPPPGSAAPDRSGMQRG